MKRFKDLPAVITLLAGFIISIIMIIHKYELVRFLWVLVLSMIAFFIAGQIVCLLLNKSFDKKSDDDFLTGDDIQIGDEIEDPMDSFDNNNNPL